jgi:hypothetical protein
MVYEQRLPALNGDDGSWGSILNQYLSKEHYNTGLNDSLNGGHQTITVRAGTTATGTAPLKLTSGLLMTVPEAGAVEFLTDKFYWTQTTSTIRKVVAAYDDSLGATGDLYYRNPGTNFTRLAAGTTGQIMNISGGIPTWSTVLSGTSKITVATTAPSTPTVGDLWIDTT